MLEDSPGFLAGKMVGNATFIVLAKYALSQTGYTLSELEAAKMLCSNFRFMWMTLEIAAMEWNTLRFLATLPGTSRSDLRDDLFEDLQALDRGNGNAFMMSNLLMAAKFNEGVESIAPTSFTDGWKCDSPPYVRGPNEGMQVRPIFDLHEPLLNLFAYHIFHLSVAEDSGTPDDSPPSTESEHRDREATSL